MIKFSREQAQVLAKLSSYFKVPRADLREDAFTASGQDDSLLRSSTLVELGFNRWLRCVPGACFGLRHMSTGPSLSAPSCMPSSSWERVCL